MAAHSSILAWSSVILLTNTISAPVWQASKRAFTGETSFAPFIHLQTGALSSLTFQELGRSEHLSGFLQVFRP